MAAAATARTEKKYLFLFRIWSVVQLFAYRWQKVKNGLFDIGG